MAKISHRLELIEEKIDNLPHQNQVENAISVSRDDIGTRFRQLLANEFGANEKCVIFTIFYVFLLFKY